MYKMYYVCVVDHSYLFFFFFTVVDVYDVNMDMDIAAVEWYLPQISSLQASSLRGKYEYSKSSGNISLDIYGLTFIEFVSIGQDIERSMAWHGCG